jgi:dTDP-4-dehydrorhamnose reductase
LKLAKHESSEDTLMIIGASGLLGKYLMREWSLACQVRGLSSRDLDIRVPEQVNKVLRFYMPSYILLAAAYTDVDGCEINPELAMEVNFRGAVNVASEAKSIGAGLLFLSSDYVFDGRKSSPYEVDDPVNPQSAYGRSKAEGERGIRELLPNSCIVRTSWVFGTGGKCFPETILQLASSRSELSVVNDQRGCPTYARDLARAIIQLCSMNAEGIIHATNAGDCTWFELASEIVRSSGLPANVLRTTTDKFPRPAKRPEYSVLSGASLRARGISMPEWQEAVHDYLRERRANVAR